MTYNPQTVKTWIADDPDPQTAQELQTLLTQAENKNQTAIQEISDCFSAPLTFGTAGLRGQLGAGPNRMNRAVVIKAAAGLTKYLTTQLPQGFTVIIGYDARHQSKQFALDTAAVVEAGGGHALLFDQHYPTPLTAYALEKLHADAAVMVTASHNPPQDNGYKVYLGGQIIPTTGRSAQIVPPYDAQIFTRISEIVSAKNVPRAASGWETIGSEIVEAYLQRITEISAETLQAGGITRSACQNQRQSSVQRQSLRIVYTAMHGVGGELMVRALNAVGFGDVVFVPEQQQPDPDFPTVAFPNPEEAGALDLAIALARQVNADLILANDPDADRVSAAIPDPADPCGFRQLTGDEIGALLGEQAAQICQAPQPQTAGLQHTETTASWNAELPQPVLANSIVSSRLLQKIAANYDLGYAATLTGFKWISRAPNLVFGYEEAIGYCVDPQCVRDKDGISAGVTLALLAAKQRAEGSNLQALLDAQARRYGLHATAPLILRVDDPAIIATNMANLRAQPPTELAGAKVVEAVDLQEGWAGLPPTDGLWYRTTRDDRVVVRPSGTEPKLKCYLEVIVPAGEDADLVEVRARAAKRLEQIKADLRQVLAQ